MDFHQGFLIAITTHVLKLSAIIMSLSAPSTAKLHLAEGSFRPGFQGSLTSGLFRVTISYQDDEPTPYPQGWVLI
jgi:hypothetical protein